MRLGSPCDQVSRRAASTALEPRTASSLSGRWVVAGTYPTLPPDESVATSLISHSPFQFSSVAVPVQ
jgi:hypothetical protein